jgi:hypothetical protein
MAKQFFTRLKFFLQHVDGIWSVPVAFAAFWFAGILLTTLFGYGTGTYDPGFIQPLFLAAAVVIGATNISIWGLFFTFRGLYRYIFGQRETDGTWKNYSKIDWLNLSTWQRYIVAFTVFFFFFASILLVFLKLV